MSTAAEQVLIARSDAFGWLLSVGDIDVSDAVQPLRDFARQSGLVDAIGRAAIDATISERFSIMRRAARMAIDLPRPEPFRPTQTPAPAPAPKPRPTPQTTIEAVMWSVREGGLAALEAADVQERLTRCDAAARRQIKTRIEALIAAGRIREIADA